MSKKQKQSQQQTQQQSHSSTNTYGHVTPPETADVQALRDFKFTADPRIGYTFGNARNQAANSFNNPLGGVYSPQMRDQILRSTLSDLSQREGQAYSEANQGLQGQQFAQKAGVASMTAPRLVQTGSSGSGTGSSSGTSIQSSPIWTDLLIAGASGAGGAA